MKYKTLNEHLRQKFGCKVYKLSLDGGFTCPNRDGTLGTTGCIFCSGSDEFAEKNCRNIQEQLIKARTRVERKNKNGKYIAYFQSFTNTYGTVEHLRKLFCEAIRPDYIVGLSIGTRPDCLEQEKIELLKEINKIKPVSVELGLQTIHDSTANYLQRGYNSDIYIDAVRRLKEAGIETVTHIIIGLPFETVDMMKETVKQAVRAGTDGIKFHMLYVIDGTPLAEEYRRKKFKTLDVYEYAQILKECLELLDENTVVHRITGDGAKKNLIAPLWSADKKKVLNYLNKYLND